MKRLGVILRCYRQYLIMSQSALASDIDIAAATLSRVENGRDIDGTTLRRILAWLLEENPNGKGKRRREPASD